MVGSTIGAILALPRRLLATFDDVRRMAEDLDAIRGRTASMDEEVARMRRGVDSLGVQVDELRDDVTRLRIPRRRLTMNGRPEPLLDEHPEAHSRVPAQE